METDDHDQHNQENPDKIISSQDDDDDEQGGATTQQQQVRSYECTFCKRGFSNAQALGGHMNIHRKDKAKLRHRSSSYFSSNDQANKQSFNIPNFSPSSNFMGDQDDRITSSIMWPWTNLDKEIEAKEKTHVGEIKQLFLFDDESSSNDQKISSDDQVHGSSTEESLSSSRTIGSRGLSSSDDQLDLELRLGPEPHDSSSPTPGTETFF